MTNKKILLKTYYDKPTFILECGILSKNKIEYGIEDRSNQINFRVPQSGYFEVDILINDSDFDKAFNLLEEITDN